MKSLGDKIRELCQKTGWAEEDLAHEIGVSVSTVQRWERGCANPCPLVRRELARLFRDPGALS